MRLLARAGDRPDVFTDAELELPREASNETL
jgi:hypothetical protein